MQQNENILTDTCSFRDVQPIMMDLSYPPIQVSKKNQEYADILSFDYCGSVSEMSAITQYINNENRLSCQQCGIAKTILGIAMAEMIHLQKLGQLIFLLGGSIDFCAKHRNGSRQMWTPECLDIPEHAKNMLLADIESEKAAIRQYRMHMRVIRDPYVNAVLARIIKDEEYHILMLQVLLKDLQHQ